MSDLFLDEIVRPDSASGGAGGRRGDRQQRDRRRRSRRRKNITALVIVAVVLGGIGVAVWKFGMPLIEDLRGPSESSAQDYPGPGESPVDVTIPAGATGADMAAILLEQDVVASTRAFTLAFAANPDAPGIQPGTYRLMTKMRAVEAVAALVNTENRMVTRVTVIEGWTLQQILDKLSSTTGIPIEDFQTAMTDVAATGLPAEAGGRYEGWLFPATYEFQPGQTPTEMVATMVAQTVSVLDARGVPADQRQAVLIKASLVERESPGGDASAMIARAIENRLAINKALEIDAAVAYGAGISGLDITEGVKDVDTPYNLYMHTGLPPTPIASPGAAAIDAVLAPADGPWMFWVTINLDTGETRFAETFDEHKANVALLREWQAENGG